MSGNSKSETTDALLLPRLRAALALLTKRFSCNTRKLRVMDLVTLLVRARLVLIWDAKAGNSSDFYRAVCVSQKM
jgi:hypothetical protein